MTRFSFRLLALLGFAFSGIGTAAEFPAQRSFDPPFAGGTFPDTVFEGVPYVGCELLDSLFHAKEQWDPETQQLRLRDGQGRDWTFTLDNPFASFKGELLNLTYPVRRGPERFYVPLHPLLRILRMKFGLNLASPKPVSPALLPAPTADSGNITGIEIETRDNGTLVVVHAPANLEWEGLNAAPHFLLKLTGGRLSGNCPIKIGGKGLVRGVTALQESGLAQITLQLGNRADSVEVLPEPNLPGFLITIRPAAAGAAKKSIGPEAARNGPGTIIVDPGHGGHDRGAVIKDVEEAVVTLAVAKELKTALQDLGYKVLLTREEDVYKTLEERPRFASDHGGDVFVSLHCNSLAGSVNRHKTVTGSTVYTLREGESEEDKALARRENQAIQEESGKAGKTEIAPVDWILLEHQLNLYSKQSQSLAEAIVRGFEGFEIPKYSTGAHQAGFFVLVGAYMPAVLFEMGFLTHSQDRRIMDSKSGRKEIAKRLAKAIDRFRKEKD